MAAREVEIADAIATELNAEARTWSMDFEAERKWIITHELQDLPNGDDGPLVEVIPLDIEAEDRADSARTRQRDYMIAIVVQKRVEKGTDEEAFKAAVDALCLLCQEIERRFSRDSVTRNPHKLEEINSPQTWVADYRRSEVFDVDALRDESRFASVIELMVREWTGA